MALQGDLSSFALPEVLRLLAGTAKSGRLAIEGPQGSGEVEIAEGALADARVSTAPNAEAPHEVIFELLRFDRGAFAFEDGEVDADGPTIEVAEALGEAEELLAEWRAVEAVVPSVDAWVALAPELDGEAVELDAVEWRAVAAIGSGASVRDLATAIASTDLDATRAVVALHERGLVSVRAALAPSETAVHEPLDDLAPPAIELDSFEEFEIDQDGEGPASVAGAGTPLTDLEHLSADERPVVMEDRDDALLPEPLPGEGVAYEGEAITGSVDGRTFETLEAFESYDLPETTAALEPFRVDAPTRPEEADGAMAGEGDAVPFSQDAGDHDSASRTSADDESPAVPALDDERGSLLRFLSTVKP